MSAIKLPASDNEAEMAVLGSCLIEGLAIEKTMMILEEEDFYQTQNRHVFVAIKQLYEEQGSVGIDIVTVGIRLRDLEKYDDVGGGDHLSKLTATVGTAGHVEYYARKVRDCRITRDMTLALRNHYENESHESMLRIEELMNQRSGNGNMGILDFQAGLESVVDEIMKPVAQIRSGFERLDSELGGFEPSELVVVGGRTSAGKTAFSLRIAAQMAMRGTPCLYITSEMRAAQLVKRLLPQAADVDSWKFRTRDWNDYERSKIHSEGREKLETLPLKMMDRPLISMKDIRAAVIQSGCKVVFIDQLQHCKLPYASMESSAIYRFCSELKEMLIKTNTLGFLLCQLDRNRDRNKEEPPVLADLRGSSGIESTANTALLLWEKKKMDEKEVEPPPPMGQKRVEVIIAKAREGPRGGKIPLNFNGKRNLFSEASFNSTEGE